MNYTPNDGFPYYLKLAKEGRLSSVFSLTPTLAILQPVDEEKAKFRYQSDKWSVKQVIGHIADHERIMMFRAFQLSRNEAVQLWGYDQESLVTHSRFDELPFSLLLADFVNVRQASNSFIETLSQNQLKRKGMASDHEVTLEEFLRSMAGHERHHVNILKERYL